jgi:hypothetical protein
VERDYNAARDATRILVRLANCKSRLDKIGRAPTDPLRQIESRLRTACESLERGALSDLEALPRAPVQNPFNAGVFDLGAGLQICEQARASLAEIEAES